MLPGIGMNRQLMMSAPAIGTFRGQWLQGTPLASSRTWNLSALVEIACSRPMSWPVRVVL
jgi:hypothetical protein